LRTASAGWGMAGIEITLEVDVEAFERAVDHHISAAQVADLKGGGQTAVRTVGWEMATNFDRPNPPLSGVQRDLAHRRYGGPRVPVRHGRKP